MDKQLIALLKKAKRLVRNMHTGTGILSTPEGIRGASIDVLRQDPQLWAAYNRGRNDRAAEMRRFLNKGRARPPPTTARPAQSRPPPTTARPAQSRPPPTTARPTQSRAPPTTARPAQSRPSTSSRPAGPKPTAPSAASRGRAAQQPAMGRRTAPNRSNQSVRSVRPASRGAVQPRRPPAVPRPPPQRSYQYRPRTSPSSRPRNRQDPPVQSPTPVAGTSRGITAAGNPRKTNGKIRNDQGRPAECQWNNIQNARPKAKAQRAGPSQERGAASLNRSGWSYADLQEPAEAVEVATIRTDQRPRDGQPAETANSASIRDLYPADDIELPDSPEPVHIPMLDEILEDLPSFFSCSTPSSPRAD